MTPDRWHEIEALFHTAHDLPPSRRAAWLDLHAPDPALRVEVESLLDSSAGDQPVTSVLQAIGADSDSIKIKQTKRAKQLSS